MANNACTMKDIKREPLSPPMSDCSDKELHTSLGSFASEGTDGQDGDQPLDFSMKRMAPVVSDSEDSIQSDIPNQVRGHHHGYTNGISYVSDGELSKNSDDQEKIGEPQTALPGAVHGAAINPGMAGIFPGLSPGFMPGNSNSLGTILPGAALSMCDHRKSPLHVGSNKHTRPFKAYPKDPLSLPLGGYYGIPGFMPFPIDGQTTATAQALTMNSDELFNQYRQEVLKAAHDDPRHVKRQSSNSHSSSNSTSSESTSVTSGTNTTVTPSKPPNPSTPQTPTTTTTASTPTSSSSRKRGKGMPDEQKDAAYWERRRKNNEAAKRSRDARRAKEDEIAIRAAFLEQENLKLRVEVAALKNETAKLRCMLYNS